MNRSVAIEEVETGNHTTPGSSASLTRELLQAWCETELSWLIYEPHHTTPLWEMVARHVRGHLCALWALGMVQGQSLTEAFAVGSGRNERIRLPDGSTVDMKKPLPVGVTRAISDPALST